MDGDERVISAQSSQNAIHYGGESWFQEPESAGYNVSTVGSLERPSFFLFYLSLSFLYSPSLSAQNACWGTVLPTIHMGLPTTVRLIYMLPHSHAKRSIPIVIPKPTEANPRLTVTGLE